MTVTVAMTVAMPCNAKMQTGANGVAHANERERRRRGELTAEQLQHEIHEGKEDPNACEVLLSQHDCKGNEERQ